MDSSFAPSTLERLQRYVRIPSPSDPNGNMSPTTEAQRVFGRMLVEELRDMGLTDVVHTDEGIVMATLPATPGAQGPTIGLIAHMDTFPGVSGEGVEPKVHRQYAGGDITIDASKGIILTPDRYPDLLHCVGHDIVTASGNTLLGADDKAGVAIIMTTIEHLLRNPDIPHAKVRIAFTVDEEIGRGVKDFDVKAFDADFAYTIDGDVIGTVEDETFNADSLKVDVVGRSSHTGTAKNVLVNAVRIASDIVASWPEWKLPETTAGREPFVIFERFEGNIERAVVHGLVRDFTLPGLRDLESHLAAICEEKRHKYPGASITVTFTEQYRNMKEILDRHPESVDRLLAAIRAVGLDPVRKPIRGGTDGARLSFMGLPTPNMFTGGANFHGLEEWVSVQGMATAAQVLVRLLSTSSVPVNPSGSP